MYMYDSHNYRYRAQQFVEVIQNETNGQIITPWLNQTQETTKF